MDLTLFNRVKYPQPSDLMPVSSPMNVLFLASEADPLIKVGGLGDVAGSLPLALHALNHLSNGSALELDIRLAIPFHPAINADQYSPRQVAEFPVPSTEGVILAKVFSIQLDGLTVYLLSGPPIDQEAAVYSTNLEADGYKYVFFSQAALELARQLNWKPHILHANDWHTAPAVYSLALQRPSNPFWSQTASLLTVHNLPYLGAMTAPALDAFGLPPVRSTELPRWARHLAMPLGLLYADSIVAVSPGYSKEILTTEFGSGLDLFLRAHQDKIHGILNGLDTQRWNPHTDIELAATFSSDNLLVRSANKSYLQKELCLEVNPQIPLLAMVTRMDPQKGVDLAVSALRKLLHSDSKDSKPLQAIFLGTGNPVLENLIRQLERDFPNQVRAHVMYSELFSRYIYAGADILLMPSRYEPCGLSQMIAMHYGCVPIARATGGLADTIQETSGSDQGTGFLFKNPDPGELAEAILRALTVYTQDPLAWQQLQIRGMQHDFSWDRSAQEYYKQYALLSG
jgi:starch synthase